METKPINPRRVRYTQAYVARRRATAERKRQAAHAAERAVAVLSLGEDVAWRRWQQHDVES